MKRIKSISLHELGRDALRLAFCLLLFIGLIAVAGLFAGCRLGPPDGRIIGVTQSTIGINIGQSSADVVPHVQLGYTRVQYHVVPTGTNIMAPSVANSMALDNSLSHQSIDEDFATGEAAVHRDSDTPAKTSARAKAAKVVPKGKASPDALITVDGTNAPVVTPIQK